MSKYTLADPKTDYNRLTCSSFAAALGLSPFRTPKELKDILTKVVPPPDLSSNVHIIRGNTLEPDAFAWYAKYINSSVTVAKYRYIPIWDSRLSGTPDGLVGEDGIIEIKCPCYFSGMLPKYYFPQIQGYLAILDREWCDYVEYVPSEDRVYVKRIKRDREWWNDAYKKMDEFLISCGIEKRITS